MACVGGAVAVTVNKTAAGTVQCSGTLPSIPVCLRSTGLKVAATWAREPHGDLVWQVVRRTGTC